MGKHKMSRRAFLYAGAAATTGAVIAACQPRITGVGNEVKESKIVVQEAEAPITPAVEKPQAVEEKVEKVVTVTPAGKPAKLTFWVGVPSEAIAVLEKQLALFQEENPHVSVAYESPPELLLQLVEAQAGGTLPDVVGLWSYGLQQLSAFLMPLDDLGVVAQEDDDFLPAGLSNSALDDKIYGLPWFRTQPCSPFFYSLGLFRESKFLDEGVALINFLTRLDVQVSSYEMSEQTMLPTKRAAYDQLELACPPTGQVVTLPPPEVERARAIAEQRAPVLEAILDQNSRALIGLGALEQPQAFRPPRSTAVIRYGDEQEPFDYDPDKPVEATMLVVATPVEINLSSDNLDKALRSESGVIVGALFGVDEPLSLQLGSGERFVVEPGANLAIKWTAVDDDTIAFSLLDETGNPFLTDVVTLVSLLDGVAEALPPEQLPLVTMELGSCRICYSIGHKVHCIDVVEGWLHGYINDIQGPTGRIYSYCCTP
jgi:hypothetical protein